MVVQFSVQLYSLVYIGNQLDLIQYKTVYSLVYSKKWLDSIQCKTVENEDF